MNTLSFYTDASTTVLSTLALGAVAPSSSDDTALRLFNNSDQYQAEDVSVTVSGDDVIQLWLSADGDDFSTSLALGDLPPQAFSAIFYLRRVTDSNDSGACTGTLSAAPSAWTNPVDTSVSPNTPLPTEDPS